MDHRAVTPQQHPLGLIPAGFLSLGDLVVGGFGAAPAEGPGVAPSVRAGGWRAALGRWVFGRRRLRRIAPQ